MAKLKVPFQDLEEDMARYPPAEFDIFEKELAHNYGPEHYWPPPPP